MLAGVGKRGVEQIGRRAGEACPCFVYSIP